MSLSKIRHWIKKQRIHSIRKSYPITITRDTEPLVKRIFIDVSVISKHDAGTGIQRVVRSISAELFNLEPENLELHTVSATRKSPYHVAAWLNLPTTLEGTKMSAQPGDVFLGLDFALDTIHQYRKQLIDFRKSGGELWFVMYDLLPLTHPQWFSEKLVTRYKQWLDDLAMLANGFYCISKSVESELHNTLKQRYGIDGGISTNTIPMGWNLSQNHPSTGISSYTYTIIEKIKKNHTALMVGTLEPRKGHIDVLEAFHTIWSENHDYNLVIVGRPGWKTEILQENILSHHLYNKKLFWISNASDEELEILYKNSTGVIVASLAEGFGLPLIEALSYGKPVLAREITVFKEHQNEKISYFDENTTKLDFSKKISTWMQEISFSKNPSNKVMQSWSDSAKFILKSFL